MAIGLNEHGVVQRIDTDFVRLILIGANGQRPKIGNITEELANLWKLQSGDVIVSELVAASDDDIAFDFYVTKVLSVNGYLLEDALDRPLPRRTRNHLERMSVYKQLNCVTESEDIDGRSIEFLAPLGMGDAGIITGPHGVGLTYTLGCQLERLSRNFPDLKMLVLVANGRSEEATYWRRRLPNADVIVGPSNMTNATSYDGILIANMLLECARRQTELGLDVVLAIDSLSGVWSSLLESEQSDSQREADQSVGRHKIREWMQCAGDFHGEGLLGSGLGGSLTVLATVWDKEIDIEAEDDGELHPHLRLLEHILPDVTWRICLSSLLSEARVFPAFDLSLCYSLNEESIIGAKFAAQRGVTRAEFREMEPIAGVQAFIARITTTQSNEELLSEVETIETKRSRWDELFPI